MSFNNYSIAFPENPADGDTTLFNQRNYTYLARLNTWYADGIDPDEVIGGTTTWTLIDQTDSSKGSVISYRADIDDDIQWVDRRQKQQSEIELAKVMIGYYPEQIAAGETLNYTLEDLNNYIEAVTWCLIEADNNDSIQWPKKPWVD